MDRYATHIPLLTRAVLRTTGSVLELGCGFYSTPLLHELCHKRELWTVDVNYDYLIKFADLADTHHRVELLDNWDQLSDLVVRPWDVVLVDHAPARQRVVDMLRFCKAGCLVVHDTESPHYGYHEVEGHFRHVYVDTWQTPWTSLYSNNEEIFRLIVWG